MKLKVIDKNCMKCMPVYDIPIKESNDYILWTKGWEHDGEVYKCWRSEDMFYILNKDSGHMFKFYKHLGRGMQTTIADTKRLFAFINQCCKEALCND